MCLAGCDGEPDADRVKTSDKHQFAAADDSERVKTSDKHQFAAADDDDAERVKTSDKHQRLVAESDKAKMADKAFQGGSAVDVGGAVAVADRKPASTERGAAVKLGAPATGGDSEPVAAAVATPDAERSDKPGWAEYTRDIATRIGPVNDACGSRLAASYDKSSYPDFDPLSDRTQAACRAAVGTLKAICAAEEGKAAVQKLSRTVCKFSTTGTGAATVGTTLVISIDPANSSITGKAAGSYSWSSAIKEVL